MVILIDAVPYAAGFDNAGRWSDIHPAAIPAERRENDPINAARGAIVGLALSGALWAGLFAAGRVILNLVAHS